VVKPQLIAQAVNQAAERFREEVDHQPKATTQHHQIGQVFGARNLTIVPGLLQPSVRGR
jgi:hypothetical protein